MSTHAEKWSEPTLIVDNDAALGAVANERTAATITTATKTEAPSASVGHLRTWKWRYPALFAGIALLLTLGAGLLYFSKAPLPVRQSLPLPQKSSSVPAIEDRLRATTAPAINDPTAASKPATPAERDAPETPSKRAASANATGDMGAAVIAPVKPIDSHAAVQLLERRLDDALAQLRELAGDVRGLTSSDAQTRQQFAGINERLRRRLVAQVEAKRIARPKLATPAPQASVEPMVSPTNNSTQLVAVDNWNGVASVSISRGGAISFLSPGERTPDGMVLKSADPVRQEAVFGLPSGATTAHHAQP